MLVTYLICDAVTFNHEKIVSFLLEKYHSNIVYLNLFSDNPTRKRFSRQSPSVKKQIVFWIVTECEWTYTKTPIYSAVAKIIKKSLFHASL